MRGRGSIGTLLALMLVLTLLPVTAFAQESAEETPAVAHAAPQEAAPARLTGENELPATTATEVATAAALQDAVANGGNIRLTDDIAITSTLVIGNGKSVTLDLQGHVLQMTGSGGVIRVNADGQLTMEDTSSGASHKFDKSSALWTLAADDATGENIVEITGGVITGGSNSAFTGAGGIVIDKDGTFLMNGGNIVGFRDEKNAGGVYNIGTFTMNGGSIRGCVGTEHAAGGIQNNNNAIMNANGGIVADCTSDHAFYGALLNDGHILVADGARSFTVFEGTARNNGIINGGIFNGAVDSGGVIGNGTFNGPVTGSGPIKDGTFTATVTRSIFNSEGEIVEITGLGTEALPYQIGTKAQLKLFRDIVNGIEGSASPAPCTYGELTADIVLNDGTFDEKGNYTSGPSGTPLEEWTPIGEYKTDSVNTPYTGTFDGQGHAIKGLYVNLESDVFVGLFGCLKGAAVRNLTVDGYVQGCSYVGGITGKAKANGSTPSTIENCRNNCRVAGKANISSSLNAGGIVGSAEDTTIAGCVNTGVVELSGSNSFSSVAGGIANSLYENVTVKNCYNTSEIKVTGDSLKKSVAGGIAGYNLYAGNTVSDCYNVGAVTVSYTGSSDGYTAKVGGIMGDISESGNTVSNCYSVGTLTSTTGTGTSDIGGVVGRNKNGTVENCYYLDSKAEKAIGNNDGTADEATGPKTAAEFGNGTVLAELINGRSNDEHPWDTTCQYLAAAGRTLPVFKGQGDTHTHQSDKWETSETEHWKVCACGAVFDKAAHSGIETANCSGGKATCSAKAQCAVCGAAYGALDPNAHGSGLKHTPAKAATTSQQGNIEYWYCANCGKFFSDAAATRVIPQADTVIEKLRHSGVTRRYPAATGQPDTSSTGKTIKSQDTGDAGVVLYAATALLSLTGAAWLTGKKRG